MSDEFVNVTKEDFEAYEEVRRSGVTNMFAVNIVCKLSGLERKTVMAIMYGYSRYKKEFGYE